MKQDFSLDANFITCVKCQCWFSQYFEKIEITLDATEIDNFRRNAKTMITKILSETFRAFTPQPVTFYVSALSPDGICPVQDEMLIKIFDKLLETIYGVR